MVNDLLWQAVWVAAFPFALGLIGCILMAGVTIKRLDAKAAELDAKAAELEKREKKNRKAADAWWAEVGKWAQQSQSDQAEALRLRHESVGLYEMLQAISKWDETWAEYCMATKIAGKRPLSLTGWVQDREWERKYGPVKERATL